MQKPRVFERLIDLEGRLRLPDYLFDEYNTCYVSLGLFSNTYLQVTPEGVYLLIDEDITGEFTDRQAFDLQRNFRTGEHLMMDGVGRIQIPKRLLARAGIKLGGSVIGEAGPSSPHYGELGHPSYWTLEDKPVWLERNPAGQYTLDVYNR